jgi:hypothetical protein
VQLDECPSAARNTLEILLRCATSRKFAASIADEAIEFSNLHNRSSITMDLGSTEMSTRDLPMDKGCPEQRADYFTTVCEPLCRKCGSLYVSQIYGPPPHVTRIVLPLWKLCCSQSILEKHKASKTEIMVISQAYTIFS